MRVLNQHNKYIIDDNYIYRILHMIENCYASVVICGKRVKFVSDDIIDDERVIIVEVDGIA